MTIDAFEKFYVKKKNMATAATWLLSKAEASYYTYTSFVQINTKFWLLCFMFDKKCFNYMIDSLSLKQKCYLP